MDIWTKAIIIFIFMAILITFLAKGGWAWWIKKTIVNTSVVGAGFKAAFFIVMFGVVLVSVFMGPRILYLVVFGMVAYTCVAVYFTLAREAKMPNVASYVRIVRCEVRERPERPRAVPAPEAIEPALKMADIPTEPMTDLEEVHEPLPQPNEEPEKVIDTEPRKGPIENNHEGMYVPEMR